MWSSPLEGTPDILFQAWKWAGRRPVWAWVWRRLRLRLSCLWASCRSCFRMAHSTKYTCHSISGSGDSKGDRVLIWELSEVELTDDYQEERGTQVNKLVWEETAGGTTCR